MLAPFQQWHQQTHTHTHTCTNHHQCVRQRGHDHQQLLTAGDQHYNKQGHGANPSCVSVFNGQDQQNGYGLHCSGAPAGCMTKAQRPSSHAACHRTCRESAQTGRPHLDKPNPRSAPGYAGRDQGGARELRGTERCHDRVGPGSHAHAVVAHTWDEVEVRRMSAAQRLHLKAAQARVHRDCATLLFP